MEFRNVKHLPRILLLSSGRHVLVGVVVKEERVRSPGERFGTDVEVVVVGREREVAIVLSHEVFLMLSVFGLNLLHPEVASRDCRKAAVEADLAPEVGSIYSVMLDGFALCGPVFGSSVNYDGTG